MQPSMIVFELDARHLTPLYHPLEAEQNPMLRAFYVDLQEVDRLHAPLNAVFIANLDAAFHSLEILVHTFVYNHSRPRIFGSRKNHVNLFFLIREAEIVDDAAITIRRRQIGVNIRHYFKCVNPGFRCAGQDKSAPIPPIGANIENDIEILRNTRH